MLEIIYKDDHLVAINKPPGLLVHRSPIAKDATEFAIQVLREQIGQPVFLVHRLDRKTSGVLLFALTQATNADLLKSFAERKIEKCYHAIVRGWPPASGKIDYDLTNDRGVLQPAVTEFATLQTAEIDLPFNNHPTSRYALVELRPLTGRYHQLRKHLAHILHPVIGDRPHGCNKQNGLWKEKFGMTRMLLHASELRLEHPVTGGELVLRAGWEEEFLRVAKMLFEEDGKRMGTGSADFHGFFPR